MSSAHRPLLMTAAAVGLLLVLAAATSVEGAAVRRAASQEPAASLPSRRFKNTIVYPLELHAPLPRRQRADVGVGGRTPWWLGHAYGWSPPAPPPANLVTYRQVRADADQERAEGGGVAVGSLRYGR